MLYKKSIVKSFFFLVPSLRHTFVFQGQAELLYVKQHTSRYPQQILNKPRTESNPDVVQLEVPIEDGSEIIQLLSDSSLGPT